MDLFLPSPLSVEVIRAAIVPGVHVPLHSMPSQACGWT